MGRAHAAIVVALQDAGVAEFAEFPVELLRVAVGIVFHHGSRFGDRGLRGEHLAGGSLEQCLIFVEFELHRGNLSIW